MKHKAKRLIPGKQEPLGRALYFAGVPMEISKGQFNSVTTSLKRAKLDAATIGGVVYFMDWVAK